MKGRFNKQKRVKTPKNPEDISKLWDIKLHCEGRWKDTKLSNHKGTVWKLEKLWKNGRRRKELRNFTTKTEVQLPLPEQQEISKNKKG